MRAVSFYTALLLAGTSVSALAQAPADTPVSPPAATAPTTLAETAPIPTPLTLAQAVDLALRLQPDLYVAQADRQAAGERLRQVNSQFLPRVTPQYTYSNDYTDVGGTVRRESRQGDISLRYQLYDAGRRPLESRQARASLRAAELGEVDTRQLIIADVADTYISVLRNQALLRVSEAQVARAQNTLDVIVAQVEAGVAARKDTLQAQADLENAQVNVLQARNNVDIAQANLKNAIGIAARTERLQLAELPAPTPATPFTATLGDTPPGETTTEAIIRRYTALAYGNRPDLAQAGQNIEANRAGVGLSRIDAGVQVTSDAALGVQFSPDTGANRGVSAQISYPLFDAGASRARVRESQAQVRASESRTESLRQQIAVEVEQSYRVANEAQLRIPAAETARRAAQLNYEAATESRREGVGTIIDVITAQTQLVQAETNYVQAVYDFYTADARLARAVGQAERIRTIGR